MRKYHDVLRAQGPDGCAPKTRFGSHRASCSNTEYSTAGSGSSPLRRSSDPAEIGGYLGSSDKFGEAIADFALANSDQNERDFEVFKQAVRHGKMEVAY